MKHRRQRVVVGDQVPNTPRVAVRRQQANLMFAANAGRLAAGLR